MFAVKEQEGVNFRLLLLDWSSLEEDQYKEAGIITHEK